jgi:hypothetical protein
MWNLVRKYDINIYSKFLKHQFDDETGLRGEKLEALSYQIKGLKNYDI